MPGCEEQEALQLYNRRAFFRPRRAPAEPLEEIQARRAALARRLPAALGQGRAAARGQNELCIR